MAARMTDSIRDWVPPAMGIYTAVVERCPETGLYVGYSTTVPVHRGRDLSPVLLRCIARDIGMSVHEFVELRR